MATVLNFIGYALLFIIAVVVLVAMFVGFKLIIWFNFRSCKKCGHTMEYCGLKDKEYMFYCKHCDCTENVPCEEFGDSMNDCNPNLT